MSGSYLDNVEGTSDQAWQRAIEYGEKLRELHGLPNLVVTVKHVRGSLYYLYVEAEGEGGS